MVWFKGRHSLCRQNLALINILRFQNNYWYYIHFPESFLGDTLVLALNLIMKLYTGRKIVCYANTSFVKCSSTYLPM
jgi:hypothetical protein